MIKKMCNISNNVSSPVDIDDISDLGPSYRLDTAKGQTRWSLCFCFVCSAFVSSRPDIEQELRRRYNTLSLFVSLSTEKGVEHCCLLYAQSPPGLSVLIKAIECLRVDLFG